MMDRLFDKGLITFDIDGAIVISPRPSQSDMQLCWFKRIQSKHIVRQNKHYMGYYRAAVFRWTQDLITNFIVIHAMY